MQGHCRQKVEDDEQKPDACVVVASVQVTAQEREGPGQEEDEGIDDSEGQFVLEVPRHWQVWATGASKLFDSSGYEENQVDHG